MNKIKTIKEALKLFEDDGIKHGNALQMSDSKAANRNYDKMARMVRYFRENNSLHELAMFYEHSNIPLRLSAAAYLSPIYEEKSIEILEEITKMEGIESFNAEMTIKEWDNGNLRNYYTL